MGMSNCSFRCVLDWSLVTCYYKVQQFLPHSKHKANSHNYPQTILRSQENPSFIWKPLIGCLCDKCLAAGKNKTPMRKAMYRKMGRPGSLSVHLTGVCSWAYMIFLQWRTSSLVIAGSLYSAWFPLLMHREKKLSFRSVA